MLSTVEVPSHGAKAPPGAAAARFYRAFQSRSPGTVGIGKVAEDPEIRQKVGISALSHTECR